MLALEGPSRPCEPPLVTKALGKPQCCYIDPKLDERCIHPAAPDCRGFCEAHFAYFKRVFADPKKEKSIREQLEAAGYTLMGGVAGGMTVEAIVRIIDLLSQQMMKGGDTLGGEREREHASDVVTSTDDTRWQAYWEATPRRALRRIYNAIATADAPRAG